MLAIRQASHGLRLTPPEALRELVHDTEEALLGGWDPMTPLKPHLGPGFDAFVQRLQAAVVERYLLPAWTTGSYALHKHADRLAAASEAFHVAGWAGRRCEKVSASRSSRSRMIQCRRPEGMRPWEPRPSNLAAHLFLARVNELQTPSNQGRTDGRCRHVHPY
jgi:hypothetical protein